MARAFISAPLDQKTEERLLRLDRGQADIKWIQPKQWHITMQFFDSVNLDELCDRFARIEAQQATGVLGPRVTQLGHRNLVVPVRGLSLVADHVRKSTGQLAPKDQLPFSGHITLGRTGRTSVPEILGADVRGSFRVERLLLIESVIGSTGAIHTVIDSRSLIPADASTYGDNI